MAISPAWTALSADAPGAKTNVMAVKIRTLTIVRNCIVASHSAGALTQTISPYHATARTCIASQSALARAQILGDHEFQSRPNLVDRADLDVDQAERQRGI